MMWVLLFAEPYSENVTGSVFGLQCKMLGLTKLSTAGRPVVVGVKSAESDGDALDLVATRHPRFCHTTWSCGDCCAPQ